MIDFTKPARTRDGRPVEIKFTDGRGDQPIVGYIEGDDDISQWNADGRFNPVWGINRLDLENIPEAVEPIVSWQPVFKDRRGEFSVLAFDREPMARSFCIQSRALALLKLTYTPGQQPTVELIEERK